MILIDKFGFLHVIDEQSGEKHTIEDKEVLSFLRFSITGVHNKLNVRDFIMMFERYSNLLALIPEFEEVISYSKRYENHNEIDLDCLCMQIGGHMNASEGYEQSSMFFNLFATTRFKGNTSLNVPAQRLSLRNVINSKIILLPNMDIDFNVDNERSYKGHLPFDVKNFTLFDFIAIFSGNLLITMQNDASGDDSFEDIKRKLFMMKDKLSESMGIDFDAATEIDEDQIKNDANNIFKQIGDIVNPKNGENGDSKQN